MIFNLNFKKLKMDSDDENRTTMIAQINEHLEILDNDDLGAVIAFLSNLQYSDDSDEDDSDEDESSDYEEPPLDPNSEEYKQLVSKLSSMTLPPISKSK